MENRFIPTLFLSLSTLAIAPFIVPAIADSQFAIRDRMDATMHFNSNQPPIAGRSNITHFLLTTKHEQTVSLAECNCQVYVQDWRDRTIIPDLPLRETLMDGKAAIATEITFPTAGSYTVVLSSRKNSAEQFEVRFPITAIDLVPAY